ncbi:Undecaprenyl-phosphate galactose phosphotransferase, WbaP/exopolysaccharide biosynthesis polyprenyl glycosylphosphotransferase [Actinopolymorpha cephalotaxi]|uniref:Exopolysaccharide biosynthesis polyprenyl glycosylphosphotransferase n=1 Tax=Actinopolymorpha cephalotaxi TaxID=504797 RepID=A0A1I2XVX3_9ACTN|nr:sugar transferase [Actinopolymorpha cephalotaxi]NYH87213.1 exopolysaccharide biosynthesis polyprenyl glycosylphosphotransferase [Actinopolymorpha cephalotaxi]SFH17555.1 Undecaprenyl-phosphate galactose phosphotransferase, WbaP/exopolysaccharide biosynthesis polyprenyl glycosylphosphotransferase [Actinopolymorpha cephalotaxi]
MVTLKQLDDETITGRAVPGTTAPLPDRRATARGMAWFATVVMVLDTVLILVAGLLAAVSRFGEPTTYIAGGWRGSNLSGVPYSAVVVMVAVVWIAVLAVRGGYSGRTFGSGADEYKLVLSASVLTAGLIAILCYLAKIELSRGFLGFAFPIGAVLLVAGRFSARKVLHRMRAGDRLVHRVLLVGMPAGVAELLEVMRREPKMGFSVVGACLPRLSKDPGDEVADEELPIYGYLDDVRSAVERSGADTVVVSALPGRSSRLLRRLSWSLEGLGVDLVVVPSLTDVAGPRIHHRPVAGLPLLHVEEPEFTGARRIVKNIFDRVGAGVVTILATPVMLAIALAIKCDDGGPVILRQTRVGVHGNEFTCFKFRSMVVDAEKRLAELQAANEHDGVLFKIRDDPRITRVGRVIRKLSLDEVPQLFNVLRGEMSLVGPRPPLPAEVEAYAEDVRRRLLVRPGITGLWQVSGRSNLSWDDSVRLDLYYVENWSLSADLVILAKTVGAVLSRNGAY